jgi:serine/threonine protein kinase
MFTATGELHLVYPWYPEFMLARVLARENFRLPLGCVECYGRQMASALKTMRQVKVVDTNISADTWLLTRKNELRLFDPATRRRTARYAGKVLMESSQITSAADIWARGCILFQLMTGELPFRAEKLTRPALLAGIGEVIGDPTIDVLTLLKISVR